MTDLKINKLTTDLTSWHDSAIKQLSPKNNHQTAKAKKNSLAVNSGMDIISHSQRKQSLHRRAYTQIKNNRSQLPQSAGENLMTTAQPADGFIGANPWQGGLTEFDTASLNIGSPFVPRNLASEG